MIRCMYIPEHMQRSTIYYNIIYIAMSSRFPLYWIFLQQDADNGSAAAATERGRDDHIVCDRRRRVVGGVRQMGKKNINNNEYKKKRDNIFRVGLIAGHRISVIDSLSTVRTHNIMYAPRASHTHPPMGIRAVYITTRARTR